MHGMVVHLPHKKEHFSGPKSGPIKAIIGGLIRVMNDTSYKKTIGVRIV